MRTVSPDQLVLPCAEPMVRDDSADLLKEAAALPLSDRGTIDIKRLSRILGCSGSVATHLLRKQRIAAYRLGDRHPWVIDYNSVVAFCDALCLRYLIPVRRRTRTLMGRYRDVDLLPFPMSDTMSVADAEKALSRSKFIIHSLIQTGSLMAYRLDEESSWRISRPSFIAYVQTLKSRFEESQRAAQSNAKNTRGDL